MNREEFIDRLSESKSNVVDYDGKIWKAKDLFDLAYRTRYSDVKLSTTDNPVELFVDLIGAVLGGGTVVAGKKLPSTPIPEDCQWVSFTSGSTGEPKAIAHKIENLIAPTEVLWRVHGVNENDTFFNIIPTVTCITLTMGIMPMLLGNGTAYCEKFNPYTTPAKFNQVKPTMMTLPPGAYSAIRRTKEWQDVKLDRMRYCLSGSNFVAPGYFDDIKSKGGVPLNGYGSTEIPGNCTAYPHSDYLGKEWYPGVEWKVTDDNQLALKWAHMEDFWISGDLVEVDPEHGIKIVGRLNNMFKYMERKVFPEVYENLIKSKIPTVTECLVKMENDRLVLLFEGEADVDVIRGELGQIVPQEMIPKRIQQVIGLPRTPLGKLVRS